MNACSLSASVMMKSPVSLALQLSSALKGDFTSESCLSLLYMLSVCIIPQSELAKSSTPLFKVNFFLGLGH